MKDSTDEQTNRSDREDADVVVTDDDAYEANPFPRPFNVKKRYRPFNALRTRELHERAS